MAGLEWEKANRGIVQAAYATSKFRIEAWQMIGIVSDSNGIWLITLFYDGTAEFTLIDGQKLSDFEVLILLLTEMRHRHSSQARGG